MRSTPSLSLALLMCMITGHLHAGDANAYSIKSTYANIETCDYVTDNVFIIWWDKTNDIKMFNATIGRRQVRVKSNDAEVYLIVAATPDYFRGNQTYSYTVKIDRKKL